MEGAVKLEVKEEQMESDNKFFTDSEGCEHIFRPYKDLDNKDIVRKELDEINDNYQYVVRKKNE